MWSPGAPLEPDFGSGAALEEKGGEVGVVLRGSGVLGEAAALEGDGGLVQEGDFLGTVIGAGGDRDLWGAAGWGGCLAADGGSCGFGGTGQGGDWNLRG